MKPAWLMTWMQINNLETLTYDMRALLEVVSDGLLNQECPSNPEDSAGVIRQAVDKLEKVRGIHEEMWSEQREAMPRKLHDGGTDEDADGEEDFDTKDLFSDNEDDWVFSEEKEKAGDITTGFTVEEIKKHEDGSATYSVNGSDEDMKKLFEAFFTQAVINGIKATVSNNEKEIAKMEALEVARELVTWLSVWESGEDIDYEPECAQKRRALSKALKAAGV
jgi:hypothetical protein